MRLMNSFSGRAFQFVLDLMAALFADGSITEDKISKLAERRSLGCIERKSIVNTLAKGGILTRENGEYGIGSLYRAFVASPSNLELDYLALAAGSWEAELFLSEEAREYLKGCAQNGDFFRPVHYVAPQASPKRLDPEAFRSLLTAVEERRLVSYKFRTVGSSETRAAKCLPWKLEYDAYLKRWWVIFYSLEEKRMIKARLENVSEAVVGEKCFVSDDELSDAMDRLLEKEPMVLRVRDYNNALERCFTVFESQVLENVETSEGGGVTVTYRTYRFDRRDIIRKLMYLGPGVTVLSPEHLRKDLLAEIDAALESI